MKIISIVLGSFKDIELFIVLAEMLGNKMKKEEYELEFVNFVENGK